MSLTTSAAALARRGGWRLPVVTLAAILFYALGGRILLPILNPAELASISPGFTEIWSRLSILALGVLPLATAVGLVELAGLVVPGLARCQTAAPGRTHWIRLAIGCIALALTALHGHAILLALAEQGSWLLNRGWGTRATGLACFLGCTIILIGLADRAAPLGIWLVIGLPLWFDLPREISIWAELKRTGFLSGADLALAIGFPAVAVASILFTCIAVFRSAPPGSDRERALVALLLWPPALAGGLGNAALVALVQAVPNLDPGSMTIAVLQGLLGVVLVPLMAWRYTSLYRLAKPGGGGAALGAPILALVIALQVVLTLAGDLPLRVTGAPSSISGSGLLIVATVGFVVWRHISFAAKSTKMPAGR